MKRSTDSWRKCCEGRIVPRRPTIALLGAAIALLAAFLVAILATISGAYLAITPNVDTADQNDISACAAIHDGWRFTIGLVMIAVGALALGVSILRARDGLTTHAWEGVVIGLAVCLLGVALVVTRNDAFDCLRS